MARTAMIIKESIEPTSVTRFGDGVFKVMYPDWRETVEPKEVVDLFPEVVNRYSLPPFMGKMQAKRMEMLLQQIGKKEMFSEEEKHAAAIIDAFVFLVKSIRGMDQIYAFIDASRTTPSE